MHETSDLLIMLKSRIPLIVIETNEELRAIELIVKMSIQLAKPVFQWSVASGLTANNIAILGSDERVPKTEEASAVLTHIFKTQTPAFFILCDFHPFFEDEPVSVRRLKEIALKFDQLQHHILLISHELNLPPELNSFASKFHMTLPTDEQIRRMVISEIRRWSVENQGRQVRIDNHAFIQIIHHLRGLSATSAERLARSIIVGDGAISTEDIERISKAKAELMDLGGVLHYEFETAKFEDVAGLVHLKHWVQERKNAFLVSASSNKKQLDFPKGIMLLGVQGSGKSLAAKAVAGSLNLPLLRLDIASLYNKYIGQSEANLKRAFLLADKMAPAVLWIDEIEKSIHNGDDADNGTSKRILGMMLTWMSERKKPVFIVATSNDVSQLPPELIRKGRLDEMFFVDLPAEKMRVDIFKIHLKKRELDENEFDIQQLAQLAEGFSGAEIEQVIISAIYSARAKQASIRTEHFVDAIDKTRPLSVIMAEKIDALRLWAKDRTVSAG